MRPIRKIILHCTDTPDGDVTWDVNRLRKMHKEERGFDDIAYHFVILQDGVIQPGRPLDSIGAHCKGHNSDSIGIAWVGRSVPTDMQIISIRTLMGGMCSIYGVNPNNIFGHYQFDPNKSCPNVNILLIRCLLFTEFDFFQDKPPPLSVAEGGSDGHD